MKSSGYVTAGRSSIGDSAADGLLAGLGAGVLMGLYLLASALVGGENPLAVLTYFDGTERASPAMGALLHLGVSGIYGMLFALGARLLRRTRRMPLGLLGIGYGLALWLLAQLVLLPQAHSGLRQLPLLAFASAHVVYGAALGWLLQRSVVTPRA